MAGDSAGFESYLRGSWWDVQIACEQSSMFLVSYNADRDENEAWVPLTDLRLSSRRGDVWDCYWLKKGTDVSVLCKHPLSNSLNLKKEGLYDARIASITRAIHAPGECTCTFSIQFLSIVMDTYMGESLSDRVLLTNEPETQVSISDIRILQKPSEIIPLQDVLDAHQHGKWIPFSRGCKDAIFLTETDLSTAKRRHGVQSDEILSPSPARVSPKNGDKGSNCDSVRGIRDGLEQKALGSHQSLRTSQVEYRIPNSASGGAENRKRELSGGYADGASPQAERYGDGATPQTGRYADGATPQIGRHADGASLQGFSAKKKCEPEEHCDEGQPNDRVEEARPPKRGRPRLNKDKTKHPLSGKKVEECLQPRLDGENLSKRDKEKTESSKKEKVADMEWTDSEGEWKPHGLKHFPREPYNIVTREKTAAPHKVKLGRPTRGSGSTLLYHSESDEGKL